MGPETQGPANRAESLSHHHSRSLAGRLIGGRAIIVRGSHRDRGAVLTRFGAVLLTRSAGVAVDARFAVIAH
jgi:hypothetical protein